MVGSRLILGCPLLQNLLNFIDERLGPSQRGALITTADSFYDCLDGSRKPEHRAIFLQGLHILRAKYGSATGVNHKPVTTGEFSADLGLQIAKILPSFLGNDLRNRPLCTFNNLCIGRHELPSQSRSKPSAHRTLASPSIAHQHDIHEKRDSRTERMTSAGAA